MKAAPFDVRIVVGGRRIGAWSQNQADLHGLMAFTVPRLSGGGACCGRQQMSPFPSDMDDVHDPEDDNKNQVVLASVHTKTQAKQGTPRAGYSRQSAEASSEKQRQEPEQYKSEENSHAPAQMDEALRKFSFVVREHGDCVKVRLCKYLKRKYLKGLVHAGV